MLTIKLWPIELGAYMLKSVKSGRFRPDADIRLVGYRGRKTSAELSPVDTPPLLTQPPPIKRLVERVTLSELRAGVPETVFEPDARKYVAGTRSYPYSAICSLVIANQNQDSFYGTGFLAGPRLVLTAGHNVYYHGEGFMTEIAVYPGLNGDRQAPPFRACRATQFATVEAWMYDADRQFDIGAIFLPTDLGVDAGWFTISRFTDMTLKGRTVTVAGFPRVPPDSTFPNDASTLWRHAGMLAVEPTRLLYTADTSIGQSGCPVFMHLPDKPDPFHAVGIHNTGYDAFNAATRINDAVFQQIRRWREQSEA